MIFLKIILQKIPIESFKILYDFVKDQQKSVLMFCLSMQIQICSSVRVFLSILAQLAHSAQSYFSVLKWYKLKCFDKSLNMQIQESMPVSIAAHL